MTKENSINMLIQISSDIAAIKQHLNDMNEKLIRHDKWLDKCPEIHRNVDNRIDNINIEIEKVKTKSSIYIGLASGFIGACVVAIINFIILHMNKIIGG